VLCVLAAPALAGGLASPGGPAAGSPAAQAVGSSSDVTVRFTVRPVIVLVVDDSGAPTQLWTNIPGTPTDAELAGVQARLGGPRGAPVMIDPALRAQLPAILAEAGWGRQGLVWQRG